MQKEAKDVCKQAANFNLFNEEFSPTEDPVSAAPDTERVCSA